MMDPRVKPAGDPERLRSIFASCPGLTRASIEKKRFNSKGMVCRVKPGNDDG